MGYLFLCIAIMAGAAKGYCGKKTSGCMQNTEDAILTNCVRMILCVIIGFFVILAGGNLLGLRPDGTLLLISALSGVSTAVFAVSWLICVKKSAYMMLDIFLLLGVLIPLFGSSLFFGESIKVTQWIGIAVLFAAVLIMGSYNHSVKGKLTPATLVLLLVCGISYGISDFSHKLFVKSLPDHSAAVFSFYTYVFSAVVLCMVLFLLRRKENAGPKMEIKKILIYILIMSACLFVNSYFKTLAADRMNAVLMYPLSQGGSLILSTLMSTFLFSEKLTAKAIVGILMAFAGLMIINLL